LTSFDGKLAVVTGGGNGIGQALVRQLAAAGCSVAVCDLDLDRSAATMALARADASGGVRLTAHACDVSDERQVERFRDEVLAQHETDHINLLVNNAGIAGVGSFIKDERSAWERVFNVSWFGVYYCTRVFMPLLIAGDAGYLVNMSSANGFWATHGPSVPNTSYSTAKFAVKGFSEALIEDLRINAPHVHVAVVLPGSIGTSIGTSSRRLLGQGEELESLRSLLAIYGLPLDNLSEEEVRGIGAVLDEVIADFSPTSATEAAEIILDGLRRNRWRIVVGEDAVALDEAVRAEPEKAYEPDFAGLGVNWVVVVLLLHRRFNAEAHHDLSASYELRLGDDRVAIGVEDGQLRTARQPNPEADAIVELEDLDSFCTILTGQESLGEAVTRGALSVRGDEGKLERLLGSAAHPKGKEPKHEH
jgi:NAD(P)-dependent dehydrogenase (short-subunit alcohol dehydrogenase family)/putative sterol carrier protein